MAIEKLTAFDFTTGVISVSAQSNQPAALPSEDPSPPLLGEVPVLSKLEEMFQGHQLDHLEMDSLALPPETLKVLTRESLKSLISDIDTLLVSAGGIAPMHEIERVSQMLNEELLNQELLAAFRRAIVGG